MKVFHRYVLMAFLVGAMLLMQVTTVALAGQEALTVIYSGNLDGELEPCGCSEEGNLGGILRRTTTLDRLKEQHPDAIVISAGGLIASQGTNDHLKSRYILKAFTELNYDAVGVQWTDLSFGDEFASKYDIPWVASNWIAEKDNGDEGFAESKAISRKLNGRDVTMRFFSWLDPDSSPTRQMPGGKPRVYDDIGKLTSTLAAAKEEGVLTVLATSLPLAIIQEQMPLANVDILFVRAGYEVYGEPKKQGNTLILEPGSRGMRLGKLQLTLDKQNNIVSWRHEVIPMPESVPEAPRMADWYKAYNAEVKEDYQRRVAIRKQQESGDSPFAGEEQCKQCHAKQHKVWQNSEHAIAFEDLEIVQKSFDPVCIQCHVVGFNQAGGFVDISLTPHLMNVQCENCHGAGKQHVTSGGQKPVANHDWPKAKMCGQCHVQKHSPSFKIDQYWPKIAH
ncbi:MAG: multiheme c-type cytochrome [Gammaproteobacteria bacterium]|jgi:2',3'-cyclic-nucleotide 2'-phosphodiesterase (5'-nucleotidase family)